MKFAKKKEALTVVILISIAALILAFYAGGLGKTEGAKAEIYYKSELVKTVDLHDGNVTDFSIEQLPNVVFRLYGDGSISFVESDCPDKVCIKTGRLHYTSQTAACLPNNVYIKIVGKASDGDPDGIIG